MKRKSLLITALSVVMVAVLAVGGTLAYFTSRDSVQNTFTMGNVSIDVQEKLSTDSTWGDGPLSFTDVVPGDTADKMARVVVNSGSADSYIRVVLTLADDTAGETKLTASQLDYLYGRVEAAVTAGNGGWGTVEELVTDGHITGVAYVYPSSVSAGAELGIFDEITFPINEMGNDYANKGFALTIQAYAVQSENVTLADVDWNNMNWDTGIVETVAPTTSTED